MTPTSDPSHGTQAADTRSMVSASGQAPGWSMVSFSGQAADTGSMVSLSGQAPDPRSMVSLDPGRPEAEWWRCSRLGPVSGRYRGLLTDTTSSALDCRVVASLLLAMTQRRFAN